jgi:hypothetical protein
LAAVPPQLDSFSELAARPGWFPYPASAGFSFSILAIFPGFLAKNAPKV